MTGQNILKCGKRQQTEEGAKKGWVNKTKQMRRETRLDGHKTGQVK